MYFCGMTEFNTLQVIKRRFFAMRNGIIADSLRRGGSPFRIIFGLNLPQLVEIACDYRGNSELAARLWSDRSTRESMLLAPMLFDPETVGRDVAHEMIGDVPCEEVADVLCHRLLRHVPGAMEIAEEAVSNSAGMIKYCAVRLAFNLLRDYPQRAKIIADAVLDADTASAGRVARSLLDEAEFLGL